MTLTLGVSHSYGSHIAPLASDPRAITEEARPMLRSVASLLLMLVLAACTAATAPSPSVTDAAAPTPGASESPASPEPSPEPSATPDAPEGFAADGLAYVRSVDPSTGATQVFIFEADGSERPVTGVSNDIGASFPVWSPDGSQLAFGGPKVGGTGIKGMVGVVNADGSEERQLGEGDFMRWSPDGTRISFTEVDDVTAEPVSHYVVDVASGEVTDLGEGWGANWLDDDRLVFNVNEFDAAGALTISTYVLTLSTGDRERVAENTAVIPSPDGSMVLLVHENVISVAPANDFTAATEIATGAEPVWAPDSTRVAVTSEFDEQARPIYAVVDLEGNTVQSGIAGYTPSWSPDGTRIATEYYNPEGEPLIHVVDVATGEVLFETEGQQPAWRP
jgi:hypothetical protein